MSSRSREDLFSEGEAHFARGEWFEAHESWEELWHGLVGEERQFVQGLIQAAVALHHQNNGNGAGAWNLARRVESRMAEVGSDWYGVDRVRFLVEFRLATNGFGLISESEMRGGASVPKPKAFPLPKLG